ncbi:MAG: non-heme iron oxygenase ferredoxin subunit [Acidimicrobiaceae bacterium]|nr:non-heme iron oxygenase ferredoxin subunit [Acidimicrobiaceae bacterium]
MDFKFTFRQTRYRESMMVVRNSNETSTRKVQLLDIDDIPEGKAKRVEIEGLRIAVTRINEDIYAVGDMCTHANYALSDGPIDTEELTIECWKHGAQFCLKTGEAISLPATRPITAYQLETTQTSLFIHLPEKGSA